MANNTKKRKVVIVGAGLVGMSYAYALMNRALCDELVLIDIDKKRAEGEAMDLNNGAAFCGATMRIFAGDYSDCHDADIVALSAGVAQRLGEGRENLLARNVEVFKSIIKPVVQSGFPGVFIVATNPVDVMSMLTLKLSGYEPNRVIGTGTLLDTARLRFLLGEYFTIDPRNIHAYVMGEHGNSEFVPWSLATLGAKPLTQVCSDSNEYAMDDLHGLGRDVVEMGQRIIEAKKATYYGIGMAMTRLTQAILGDEHSVLTVSAYLDGEYGQHDVYAGSPCVIGTNGVIEKVEISLNPSEALSMSNSCEYIRSLYSQISLHDLTVSPV